MMDKAISAIFIFVGLINFAPVIGLLSVQRLQALYGLSFEGADLQILMRHRALLFGLLGALLIYAAFRPSLQPLAFVAGFVAMVGFIFLAWQIGGYGFAANGASINKVVMVDVVATLALAIAGVLYLLKNR